MIGLIPFLATSLFTIHGPSREEVTRIRVDTAKPTVKVSPYLYGIFFEEINCSGDGGIYAELVRNRSFEESKEAKFWTVSDGTVKVQPNVPVSPDDENKQHLEWAPSSTQSRLINEGYWGIPARLGETYDLSFMISGPAGRVTASLETPNGESLCATSLNVTAKMSTVQSTLRPSRFEPNARLVFRPENMGTYELDMVSLFPRSTFKSRPNGLRSDLATMLNAIKPAFMRFPGGCWVEGETMATAMRWKKTINSLDNRRTQPNLWGYTSPNGLGYFEYLQMCEDLGAAPLFVINCGMSHQQVVPMDQMDEYVQDALDAIEYANGPATSKWGAVRAKNGHPKPFNLKFMEIGNENGGPAYNERYKLIYEAVHKRYPEIGLVADVWGGTPTGAPVDIVDEHYYNNPAFFFANANRYDSYDRKGPKVYVGEYAVTQGCGGGNLIAAVSEAAFMCGMERNSDQVVMASYAPLFANVNYKKWNPDLINFNGTTAYGTPSYYVQELFAKNRADTVLSTTLENDLSKVTKFPTGAVGVSTWRTQAEYKDLVVTKAGAKVFESKVGESLASKSGVWRMVEGAIRQTSNDEGTRAIGPGDFGDTYSVSVKARKISGDEGFMLDFGYAGEKDWLWLNIGGWRNSQHGLELETDGGRQVIGSAKGKIETGRWYEVRADVSPTEIRCFLDGKVLFTAKAPSHRLVHVVSGRDEMTNELIVKIVNADSESRPTELEISGISSGLKGTVEELTSNKPTDENSIESPTKVLPTHRSIASQTNKLSLNLPPYSVSILRLKKS